MKINGGRHRDIYYACIVRLTVCTVHRVQKRLLLAVVVLRKFPHEDAAQAAGFESGVDFERGGGGSVVGDEADVIGIAVDQVWGLRERIGVGGPATGGNELLDLLVVEADGCFASAEIPEAIDVEAVAVEGGAEIYLLGGNVELIAEHIDGSLEAAFLAGIERAEVERRIMAGVIGPRAVEVVGHDVEEIEQRDHAGEIVDAIRPGAGGDSGGDQILSGGQQSAHGLDEQREVEGFGLVVGNFVVEVEAVVSVGDDEGGEVLGEGSAERGIGGDVGD